MAKHNEYKTDKHLLINIPHRYLICYWYWVVQYNREFYARKHDYLASLAIIFKEKVSCH